MSNPSISMGKLPIKGILPIILKGFDFKLWSQNTDRKNYVGFTYNIPIIIYSVGENLYNTTEMPRKHTTNFIFVHLFYD